MTPTAKELDGLADALSAASNNILTGAAGLADSRACVDAADLLNATAALPRVRSLTEAEREGFTQFVSANRSILSSLDYWVGGIDFATPATAVEALAAPDPATNKTLIDAARRVRDLQLKLHGGEHDAYRVDMCLLATLAEAMARATPVAAPAKQPPSDMIALLKDKNFSMVGGSEFALSIVAALASTPLVVEAPRMLTSDEVKDATGLVADWASEALQRKFMEVNGLAAVGEVKP